jgi:D-aminoacyl-tRNA deacylase
LQEAFQYDRTRRDVQARHKNRYRATQAIGTITTIKPASIFRIPPSEFRIEFPMRACIQRVSRAAVTIAGESVGQIERGLLVLLGVAVGDSDDDAKQMAQKIVELRIFEDDAGKMNRSLAEAAGAMLVVSQFTLLGDCRKGRRPSFIEAAPPEEAQRLYQLFVSEVQNRGIHVETGRFREHMEVSLVNDGPVTLLLDSRKTF